MEHDQALQQLEASYSWASNLQLAEDWFATHSKNCWVVENTDEARQESLEEAQILLANNLLRQYSKEEGKVTYSPITPPLFCFYIKNNEQEGE